MKTVEATSIVVDMGQNRLSKELERLKRKLGLGYELIVEWLPGGKVEICGEVKGNIILIYEGDETKAMETLRHEFLDFVISQTVEPYQKIANKLIGLINDEAYLRKEKLVEALVALI
jgi:hypothetical protein